MVHTKSEKISKGFLLTDVFTVFFLTSCRECYLSSFESSFVYVCTCCVCVCLGSKFWGLISRLAWVFLTQPQAGRSKLCIVILFLILTDPFIYFVLNLYDILPLSLLALIQFAVSPPLFEHLLSSVPFTFMISFSIFWFCGSFSVPAHLNCLSSSDFIQSFHIYLNVNQFPYFLQMTTSVLLKALHLATSSPKVGHRDPEVTGVEAEVEDRNQITGKSTPQVFFYKVFRRVNFLTSLLLNLRIFNTLSCVLGDETGIISSNSFLFVVFFF